MPSPMRNVNNDPSWFNYHEGSMMNVRGVHEKSIVIAPIVPNGTRVEITRQQTKKGEVKWLVSWRKTLHDPFRKVPGSAVFTQEDLVRAFKLSNQSNGGSDKLRQRFKADAAEERKYIRRGEYLNIPSAGTGKDNDHNISIFLANSGIGNALRDLINQYDAHVSNK